MNKISMEGRFSESCIYMGVRRLICTGLRTIRVSPANAQRTAGGGGGGGGGGYGSGGGYGGQQGGYGGQQGGYGGQQGGYGGQQGGYGGGEYRLLSLVSA